MGPCGDDGPRAAARALLDGRLAALPTETVYGLGARADLPRAIARVYAAKGRPADHPLIVHVADADAAAGLGGRRTALRAALADALLARSADPGAAPLRPGRRLRHRRPGHRRPARARHPVMRAVLRELGSPAGRPRRRASPRRAPTVSAGSARRRPRTCATELADASTTTTSLLDGGASSVGVESTIVDCTGPVPVLLRPGTSAPPTSNG